MKRQIHIRGKGRPRAFDVEKALDQALEIFHRKGYEGTSVTDLTEAIGIERPSLYAAFGDKETLFRKALDRYVERAMGFMESALAEKTARGFAESLLISAATLQTDPRNPRGCLTVQGALACGEESEPVRKELACRREQIEGLIRERLKLAKREADLPAGSNPTDLARYIATVLQGMSVQAASGATRNDLLKVVDITMKAWPA